MAPVINKQRKRSSVIAIITIVLVAIGLTCDLRNITDAARRSLRSASNFVDDGDDDRPVMHTFFHGIIKTTAPTKREFRRHASDAKMLETWEESWQAAGFRTKILTLQDAEKHPVFQTYVSELEKVPLLGSGGTGKNALYNALCFYRWLAMATVEGGGWMCDYDVLPLHISGATLPSETPGGALVEPMESGNPLGLPNEGRFTVYAGGVPALMSGTAEEWTRMARTILWFSIKKSREEPERLFSDMLAVLGLKKEGVYIDENYMLGAKEILPPPTPLEDLEGGKGDDGTERKFSKEEEDDEKDPKEWKRHCDATDGKMAIHFSHYDLTSSRLVQRPDDVLKRPKIAKQFLNEWNERCKLASSSHATPHFDTRPRIVNSF